MRLQPVLIIILLVLLLVLQGASAETGESIVLEYRVTTSAPIGVLISEDFLTSVCNASWTYNYSAVGNGSLMKYSIRRALLVLPEKFNVTVFMRTLSNGTVLLNVTLHFPEIRVYGVVLSLNVDLDNRTYRLLQGKAEPLCQRPLQISYAKRLLAGLIPVSIYEGAKSIDPITLFYARPQALGDMGVTLYSPGNWEACTLKLAPKANNLIQVDAALLAPPPGRAYKCCGIVLEQSETMVPAQGPLPDRVELLDSLAALISNETGITLHRKVINFHGYKLVSYYSDPMVFGNYSIVFSIKSVSAGVTEPSMLYHAAHGFLVEWNSTGLDAFATTVSLLSDAFLMRSGDPFPLGGQCILSIEGDESIPQALSRLSVSATFDNITVNISLSRMSVREPPRATLAEGGSSEGPREAMPLSAVALGAAAIVVGALAILVYGKRLSRERG